VFTALVAVAQTLRRILFAGLDATGKRTPAKYGGTCSASFSHAEFRGLGMRSEELVSLARVF
jgi:hypothetical protein